ncbi:hypothetical protein EDD11_001126 [Mortierella claussenii]|nr:hypothetical protein EDD11_001126 [Mortierella claussenii]
MSAPDNSTPPKIIDIRTHSNTTSERQEPNGSCLAHKILSGLCPKESARAKTIPTVVLYNDRGLQLFDEITYLKEYYLTHEEVEILERDADRIVDYIPDNSVVVELGSGSLRKTVLLLNALERKRKNISYYAMDLMVEELTKSLKSLGHFNNIEIAGLWGTYDEGVAFMRSLGQDVPKTLLWLGSSIGSLDREDAKQMLISYRRNLNKGDNWLIGIDRRNNPEEIVVAYNDPKGVTREFIMNGLDHANALLGQQCFDRTKFEYFARYNNDLGRHEAYYKVKESHQWRYKDPESKEETVVGLARDELINMEYSYKWSPEETAQLFKETLLEKVCQWTSASSRYDLHLVRK